MFLIFIFVFDLGPRPIFSRRSYLTLGSRWAGWAKWNSQPAAVAMPPPLGHPAAAAPAAGQPAA